MSFWLEERNLTLHSNTARRGDADYGITPADSEEFNKLHPRAQKGTHTGGKFVRRGDTGAEVSTIQRELGVAQTGTFDSGTVSSIIAFQKANGLAVDGIVGRQTALALTGQVQRARRVGPGALGPYTSKLIGADSRPHGKRRSRAAKHPAERVGGGLLVASLDESLLLENRLDALGHLHDLIGRFAPKVGSHKATPNPAHSVPEYDPKGLKFGKLAGGSNGARIAHHQDGSRWLVKSYQGNENRVSTELLSNAVYREMGARVPRAGRVRLHNGRNALAYPLLEGKPRPFVFQRRGAQPSPEVGKHFMTDALLANWDVAGLEDDNVLWDRAGQPFRVDQGGTLEYRAQGGRKDFGPVPYEVSTMMDSGGQGRRSSAVDYQGMRKQAAQIHKTLTPQRIDQLVDAAQFRDAGMRERVRRNLKGRVDWMGKFAQGQVGLPQPPQQRVSEAWDWLEEQAVIPHEWEEALHPRDQLGKFIKKIGGLPGGKAISLDSRTTIKKDRDGTFRVVRSGGIIKGFSTPEDAARAALDRSVRAKDADSIGGNVSHRDFNAYLRSRGVDATDPNHFGGRATSADSLHAEMMRLQRDLTAARESGDRYRLRAVPTLEARLKESVAKYNDFAKRGQLARVVKGDDTPSLARGGPVVEPGDTYISSHGQSAVVARVEDGRAYNDKGHFIGHTEKIAGAAREGRVQLIKRGQPVPDVTPARPIGTAIPSALEVGAQLTTEDGQRATITAVDPRGLVDFDYEKGGSASAHINVIRGKLASGQWKYEGTTKDARATERRGFTLGDRVEMGWMPPIGSKLKIGDNQYEVTASHPKNGIDIKAEGGSDTYHYPVTSVTAFSDQTHPGVKWTWLDGGERAGGERRDRPAGRAIRRPQANAKSESTYSPYTPLRELDMAPGDIIQYKKGGWRYELLEPWGDSGAWRVKGPDGKTKVYSGWKGPQFVTKADGSELKSRAPGAPGTPAAPEPVRTWTAENFDKATVAPDPGVTIGDLGDGTLIKTPDGRFGIVRPSEPAYSGYVTAYDIMTGQKFEPPAGKPPVKVSTDPNTKMRAREALDRAQTLVNRPTVAREGGGSSEVVGPPPAFIGVPHNSAAESYLSGLPPTRAKLSDAESSAVKSYTNGLYSEMNESLRSSKGVKSLSMARKVRALDDAIAKAPEFDQSVVLSRKTSVAEWTGAEVGSVIQDNGFLSTSAHQGTWNGQVHLKILCPPGSKGLWVNKSGASSHPQEKEVILPRGSQFHVLKREQTSGATTLYVEMIA